MKQCAASRCLVRTMTTMALKEQKSALRKRINDELKKLGPYEIERQCVTMAP
jgi:hypothetical protein